MKKNTSSTSTSVGGNNRENSQEKESGVFQGYLEHIWRNPSLVKFKKSIEANNERPRKTQGRELTLFFIFLSFPLLGPPVQVLRCL